MGNRCTHPGIVKIVEQAREISDELVHMVLIGFHLGRKSEAEIVSILKDFRRLGVEQVRPCHCSRDFAISMFSIEYGENYIQSGVGKIIMIDLKKPCES